MKWIFIIDVHGAETAYIVQTSPFLTKQKGFSVACEKLHDRLRLAAPEVWSEDWRDLRDDVHNSEQTCYGPYRNNQNKLIEIN